ncbi:MAG TPA: glycoside hydrolase family 172 protein [Chitinophagaceae bacterium]|nr:glycoside hydrolase family 172 protein [Chitinophagaceae bacterium]
MKLFLIACCVLLTFMTRAQESGRFNGLDMNMGNLSRLSDAKTRSISPENFSGAKGRGGMADPVKNKDQRNVANAAHEARDLGTGWKVNPFIIINGGETVTIAEMEGPGAVQHIWMTPTGNWRFSIIRFYWDDEKEPSIEVPVGDFFGMAWNEYAPLNSMAVTVNPGSAFNCYWKMPFRRKCRITMENINNEPMRLYYQVDYTLTEVGADEAYLHAQYRRSHPTKGALHTILDGVKGKGHYVGTYMAVGVHNNGWWGEGEIKFFMDGDKDYATIVGTGTEDYFCGSYNFENKRTRQYEPYSTAYAGLHQVIRPDGLYTSQQRFGMYRWHIMDPVRFENDLRITIQDLGWRAGGRYLPQQSDISTVAFWYQREPHAPFPKLPAKDDLEVN